MMKKILISIGKEKKFLWFFLGVVALSFGLRFWRLGEVPFVADEFLDVNATYGYHQTGKWQAWDFNLEQPSDRFNPASDERAWLYRWQVAQLYKFLTPTERNIRLISLFWGVLTTILIFLVTWSFLQNRWIALLASFFWAVSVPAIEMNRMVRMYSMFVPIFLLFSWSLFRFFHPPKEEACFWKKKATLDGWKNVFALDWNFLPLVIFLGLIAYHLHPLAGNTILVLGFYFLLRLIVEKEKKNSFCFFLYLLFLFLAIMGVFSFLPSQWRELSASLIFFENHWGYLEHALKSYWHPLLGVGLIGLGAYYLTVKQSRKKAGLWLTVSFFSLLLAAIFLWNRNVGPQYFFFVQPFGFILLAAGIFQGADFLKRRLFFEKNQQLQGEKVFVIFILISIFFLPDYQYFFLKNNTYHITSSAEQVNYRKVFSYIKKKTETGDAMIARNFRSYYWSGLGLKVLDFGSERSADDLEKEGKVKKITVPIVESFVVQNPRGWVVFSDNDEIFITKEARAYFEENFQKIDDSLLVRGNVSVYRWGETFAEKDDLLINQE